ncbi:MAG: hypothetical protein R3256_02695 [Thalassovita sp.]|nr:hypothetical protein [Thalassovita sp.]
MPRFKLFQITALALLTGCTSFGTYYREGTAVARMNNDLTDCQVRALRDVPVAQEIRHTPSELIVESECDENGENCVKTVKMIEGRIYTVDTNKALRDRVEAQCMIAKGYAWLELPACSSSVASATPETTTRIFPALTPESCAIRHGGGRWQIVTPG